MSVVKKKKEPILRKMIDDLNCLSHTRIHSARIESANMHNDKVKNVQCCDNEMEYKAVKKK